jgi:hypothetical protein
VYHDNDLSTGASLKHSKNSGLAKKDFSPEASAIPMFHQPPQFYIGFFCALGLLDKGDEGRGIIVTFGKHIAPIVSRNAI